MSPSAIASMHRLSTPATALPPLCLAIGSALLADAILCGLGTPMFPHLYRGNIAGTQVALLFSGGLCGMLLLAWAIVPSWSWCWRLLAHCVPPLRWLARSPVPDHIERDSYRLSAVVRRAVERGNKQASDMVNERRLEVSREQALRATAAALLAAAIVNACMSGSALRLFDALIRDGNAVAWIGLIVIVPAAFIWIALAYFAFSAVEVDDWVEGHALKPIMEEPSTTDHSALMAGSPLARHAPFPAVAERPEPMPSNRVIGASTREKFGAIPNPDLPAKLEHP